ncbi:MAG: hypothetical protein M1828_004348 [Chrysothrix sp. TS-e1954]|nr:MAG: hypothetical protein M1828_004348 [Chrysothrix sp. TS-e1954]
MPHWYVSGRGWIDERGRFNKPPKRNYAWIWPNDRNRGAWGRFADILSNKGPDMFIAMNPNRKAGASDGPSRKRWTNWPGEEIDDRQRALDAANFKGGFGPASFRKPLQKYDFRTRRYRYPRIHDWTDVENYPNSNKPSAVMKYPDFVNWIPMTHNGHLGATAWTDPRNFAQNTLSDGMPFGGGGYWHPQTHGMPLDFDDP